MIIYKYPLKIQGSQVLSLPTAYRPLALQMQDGVPTLWVALRTPVQTEQREHVIVMFGTGHATETNTPGLYLGTVQDPHTGFVWHYFDTDDRADDLDRLSAPSHGYPS